MTVEAIKTEIRRRIAAARTGADTYPDLANAADTLENLLAWIEAQPANEN